MLTSVMSVSIAEIALQQNMSWELQWLAIQCKCFQQQSSNSEQCFSPSFFL